MRSFILVIIMILGITGCSFDKTVSFTEKTEVKTQYQVVDDKGNILDFTDTPKRIYATTLSLEEILTDLVPHPSSCIKLAWISLRTSLQTVLMLR